MNGQQFGVLLSLSGSLANLPMFSSYNSLALGFCPVFRWPISQVPAKEPSVPRAGRHDPGRVHASPVARAQTPWASRYSNSSLDFSSYYFITKIKGHLLTLDFKTLGFIK